MIKKAILFFTLIAIFTLSAFLFDFTFSLAENNGSEEPPPRIDSDWAAIEEPDVRLYTHIQSAISLLTTIAAIISFLSLTYGGFLWVTSAGEPLKMKKSKNRILHAIVGLVIVLASFIIANTINPRMITITSAPTQEATDYDRSGVYISLSGEFYDFSATDSPEERQDKLEKRASAVRRIDHSSGVIGSFVEDTYRRRETCEHVWEEAEDSKCPQGSSGDYCCYREGKIQEIRIANPPPEEGNHFVAAILHSEENFQGDCRILFNETPFKREYDKSVSDIGDEIRSITVVHVNPSESPYGGVVLWNDPEYQGNSQSLGSRAVGNKDDRFTPLPDGFDSQSIDIEGSYAVVLASAESWGNMDDGCLVFERSVPRLSNYSINQCDTFFRTIFFAAHRSCATHYAVFPKVDSR